MKKILFVMPALTSGGAEKSLVNLLNIIDPKKYEVDLLLFRKEGVFLKQIPVYVNVVNIPMDIQVCYSKTKCKSLSDMVLLFGKYVGTGITRLFYGNTFRQREKRWSIFYNNLISQLDKQYDVAVAYLHGESTYYVIDKVKADKKIVWVHNDYDKIDATDEFQLRYFEKAHTVVTISEECSNKLKTAFSTIEDKFMVLPNLTSSVLTRKLADEYFPAEFSKRMINILSVGRLSNQKGFDMAVEAAKILKEKGFSFKWIILGVGELEEKIKKAIEKYELTECFILAGIRENPYPYIKNCDILVQPSRFEGKSVVLDEAKILGKPILATNYATVRDQIRNDYEGVVCGMNPNDIAVALDSLINDEEQRNALTHYLMSHEYGNQNEVKMYYSLFD